MDTFKAMVEDMFKGAATAKGALNGRDGTDRPVSGRKTGRTDWFGNRRIRSCICWDIRSAVYFNGVLCKCKTKIQIFLPNGSWYVTLSTENKGNEVLP